MSPSLTRRRLSYALLLAATGSWLLFFFHLDSLSDLESSLILECAGDEPDNSRFTLFASTAKLNSSYLPFKPPATLPTDAPTLLPVSTLPNHCLDRFVADGQPCFDLNAPPPTFDIVWTWVNGSDKLHEKAVAQLENEYFPPQARPGTRQAVLPKLFRDHDELRHSMRSVLQNFRPYSSQFHLVTADFPFPDYNISNTSCEKHDSTEWRLGQIPQYLDLDQYIWQDGSIKLRIAHHAQFFREYQGTVFNSFAIESQLSRMHNVSENFIYLNDDYFFVSQLTPFDFRTDAFGPVLRLQTDSLVRPSSILRQPSRGEWLALEHSNEILSQRFGYRNRPYGVHLAKTGSTPLMHEMSVVFDTMLTATASNRFRASPFLPQRDSHPFFLFGHFLVERWREALLWTWAVAKIGGPMDQWTAAETERAWRDLGGHPSNATLVVKGRYRKTLERQNMLDLLGPGGIGKTTYEYSSHDGYPFHGLGDRGWRGWADYVRLKNLHNDADGTLAARTNPAFRCTLSLATCFPSEDSRASEVFKQIAFQKVQCGDCIISALVAQSGEAGLSAFLPESTKIYPPPLATDVQVTPVTEQGPPHLPLEANWEAGDFTLKGVLRKWTNPDTTESHPPFGKMWPAPSQSHVNVREWAVHLLHRYRFVIANTPSMFVSISSPQQARSMLARIDTKGAVGLLCVNDDINNREAEVNRIFRDWQDRTWNRTAKWEIPQAGSNW